MSKTTSKYFPEVRERAVRMVLDHQGQYESRWSATLSISSKIGCAAQMLNKWIKKVEIDSGRRGVWRHQQRSLAQLQDSGHSAGIVQ